MFLVSRFWQLAAGYWEFSVQQENYLSKFIMKLLSFFPSNSHFE